MVKSSHEYFDKQNFDTRDSEMTIERVRMKGESKQNRGDTFF